jgi:hypothetical protein
MKKLQIKPIAQPELTQEEKFKIELKDRIGKGKTWNKRGKRVA